MTSTHHARYRLPLTVLALAGLLAVPTVAAGSSTASVRDGRSPDTLDAAFAASSRSYAEPLRDGRSPDTLDAALSPQPVLFSQPSGFDWGDAGIGAGFASGVLALLAATALLWGRRHPRHRIQTT